MLIVEYNTSTLKERGNTMQLAFKTINKTLIASITGEIDHHTSEDVRERIDRYIDNNSVKNIIFDLTNVMFMDSAGIGVIIGRYKKVSPLMES
jgi:stage II sporulation protein AA (anti-sigma F factor antagonist)